MGRGTTSFVRENARWTHGMPEVVKVRENGEVTFGRATQSMRKRFQPAVVNGSQGPFTKGIEGNLYNSGELMRVSSVQLRSGIVLQVLSKQNLA